MAPKAAPSSPANDLGRSLRPRASAAKAESFAPSSSRKRLSTAPDGSQAKRQPAPPRVGMNPLPKVDALRHLIPDGKKLEVFCFGTGGSGELGFEVDDEVPTPRRQPWFNTALQNDSLGPRGLEDLVLGGMHALCRDSNGRVLSFGVNDGAALGRVTVGPGLDKDDLEATPTPVINDALGQNALLAAGDSVSVFVDTYGSLAACGSFRADEGLFGFTGVAGAPQQQFTPIPISHLSGIPIAQAAVGNDHVVALDTYGKVYVWGSGQHYQLGRKIMERRQTNSLIPGRLHLRNIALIGAGSHHSHAVDVNGKVYAWGPNAIRQTGVADEDGGAEEVIETPTVVSALDPDQLGGARVVQVDGGDHHSLFLLDDGRIFACGRADYTGVDTNATSRVAYRQLVADIDQRREDAAKAELHRLKEGDIYKEQVKTFLGEPNETMRDYKLKNYNEQIESEAKQTVALQITKPLETIEEPVEISFGEISPRPRIISISVAARHNLAVDDKGIVYSWGSGNQGELGLGSTSDEAYPRIVAKLGRYHIVKAEAGGVHSFLLGYLKEDAAPKVNGGGDAVMAGAS